MVEATGGAHDGTRKHWPPIARHRHRHADPPGQGRGGELGRAFRRAVRHPSPDPLPHRGPAHHHRRLVDICRTIPWIRADSPASSHGAPRRAEAIEGRRRQPGAFPGEMFLGRSPRRPRMVPAHGAGGPRGRHPLSGDPGHRQRGPEEFDLATFNGGIAARLMPASAPRARRHPLDRLRLRRLGDPARRRGDPPRRLRTALCIGTDGSIQPEALIRFSLLSALSMANEDPSKAAKPFSEKTATASSWPRARRPWCWRARKARGRGARSWPISWAAARRRTPSTARGPIPAGRPWCAMREALFDAGLAQGCGLHQCPWDRHAGERQDGDARDPAALRRPRHRSRSAPTNR